eukprot:PhM_4_TR8285/c1_g1_i1/m.92705/K10395/KIF4_21_27; kinesin family member 4/21/27
MQPNCSSSSSFMSTTTRIVVKTKPRSTNTSLANHKNDTTTPTPHTLKGCTRRAQQGSSTTTTRLMSLRRYASNDEFTQMFDIRWFAFDALCDADDDDDNNNDDDVYHHVCRHVSDVLWGYNATILFYGQVSSGKTFTFNEVFPKLMHELFDRIGESKKAACERIVVTASFIEVFDGAARDLWRQTTKTSSSSSSSLLKSAASSLNVKLKSVKATTTSSTTSVHVPDLSVYEFDGPSALLDMVKQFSVERRRHSHTILTVHVRRRFVVADDETNAQPRPLLRRRRSSTTSGGGSFRALPTGAHIWREDDGNCVASALTFVDLAGVDDPRRRGTPTPTTADFGGTNASLTTLRTCFDRIANQSQLLPPFRDSVLTKLLVNSIGGNCRTTIVATVSTHPHDYFDTLNTLRFASVARRVRGELRKPAAALQQAFDNVITNALQKKPDDTLIRQCSNSFTAVLRQQEEADEVMQLSEQRHDEQRTLAGCTAVVVQRKTNSLLAQRKRQIEEGGQHGYEQQQKYIGAIDEALAVLLRDGADALTAEEYEEVRSLTAAPRGPGRAAGSNDTPVDPDDDSIPPTLNRCRATERIEALEGILQVDSDGDDQDDSDTTIEKQHNGNTITETLLSGLNDEQRQQQDMSRSEIAEQPPAQQEEGDDNHTNNNNAHENPE